MFVQDLIKPSIWLDKDSLAPTPGTQLDGGGPTPMLGACHGEEPGSEVAAVTKSSGSDLDWRKLIFKYLWLKVILDDETETQRLAR
jgi:hypothetical protein